MARLSHPSPLAKRLLPIAIAAMAVTAFLPPAAGEWPRWFGGVIQFFVAPISQPVRGLSGWLAPPEDEQVGGEGVRALQQQAEGYRQQLLRAQLDIDHLRGQIAELQRGRQLNPELPVRQMHAAVIGTASDLSSGLLWIKAGRSDGVEPNSVAAVRGQQLLGRVVRSDERTCHVQPITTRSAGQIRGVVMLSDLVRGPECLLEPRGNGTLVGPVEDMREWPPGAVKPDDAVAGEPVRPIVGQTVRLMDPSWPRSSQMLLIGVVERVEPAGNQPLRQVITVRPTVRLERVSEVLLRFASTDTPAAGRDLP
ncbi:MAG: hypothetical protein KF787_02610 [Phycisphaeraceae bacterium]|nr:hypothetical protein [Phycisphaerae bacterium]MBX3391518.1 hypothetical protein [Phycisphaeraceae bacterium]